jgi:hypothetical protein
MGSINGSMPRQPMLGGGQGNLSSMLPAGAMTSAIGNAQSAMGQMPSMGANPGAGINTYQMGMPQYSPGIVGSQMPEMIGGGGGLMQLLGQLYNRIR